MTRRWWHAQRSNAPTDMDYPGTQFWVASPNAMDRGWGRDDNRYTHYAGPLYG